MTPALLAAALLASTGSPADRAWSEQNADRIVAVAGGQIVTVSDIRRELGPYAQTLRGTPEEKDAAVSRAVDEVLRSLTDRAVVLSEFRAGGATIPPAMVQAEIDDIVRRSHEGDRLRYYAALRAQGVSPAEHRRQVEEKIIFDYMLGQVRRSIGEASPARIQAYYEANLRSFARPEEVRFRQISFLRRATEKPEETLARARAARAAVVGDGSPAAERFAAAAKAGSDDDYREEGGDAGWRSMTDLAGPVAEALRGLPDGGVSELLTLDVGPDKAHFLLLRTQFRPAGTAPIEEVRQQIAAKVREELGNEAIRGWLARLRQKHAPEAR